MKQLPHTLTTLAPALLLAAALAACSSAPRTPDWQIEAKGALDRAIAAYLTGNTRVEQAEAARARQQLASTGRADRMAAAELRLCAARVASLVWEDCAGFASLRQDATPAQHAYADYLRGQVSATSMALLPPAQRAAAAHTHSDGSALQDMEDPLSLLVAAGVLLQIGKANPAIIEQAVNVASDQGWRRPLLAWLDVQLQRSQQAGQTVEAERVRRRIALVQGSGAR